jgi:lipoprotein NlpI
MADIYNVRGSIKTMLCDNAGACEDFTSYIDLEPSSATGYFYRAAAWFSMGNCTAALDDYNKVIELEPMNGEAFYNRAEVRTKLTQHRDAFTDRITAYQLGYKGEVYD